MTTKNNFNCSDSGINISVTVEYDFDLAQYLFDESLTRIGENKYLYTDNGNLSSGLKALKPQPRQKGKLIKLLLTEWEDDFTRAEISKLDQDDLVYLIEDWAYDESEREGLYNDYNIEIENPYCEIVSRGYNQGDYAKVLIHVTEFENVTGAKFDENQIKEIIHNILWDSPQYVQATINGEEYISEKYHGFYANWLYGDGSAKYDQDVFLAELLEQTKNDDTIDPEVLRAELEEILPVEVSYPY